MRIQEHIDKISWSFADKFMFILFGLVTIYQFKFADPYQIGIYSLLINLIGYLMLVCDSLALNGIIQFGANEEKRPAVRLLSITIFITIVLITSIILFSTRFMLDSIFHDANYNKIGLYFPIISFALIPRIYAIKVNISELNFKNVFLINFTFFGTLIALTLFNIFKFHSLEFKSLTHIYLYSSVISSLFSLFLLRKTLKFKMFKMPVVKEYLNFTLPMTLVTAFHSAPRLLDGYIIQFAGGTAITTAMIGVYNSAKTVYRIFDEISFASTGLVYPAAVRQIEKNNKPALFAIFSKSFSFLFIIYIFAFLVLELGTADYFFNHFLPLKYKMALPEFKILLFAILPLPLQMLGILLTASNKPKLLIKYTFISAVFSVICFYLTSKFLSIEYVCIGVFTYNLIFGLMCLNYFKINFGLPVRDFFRAINDSMHFIKSIKKGK